MAQEAVLSDTEKRPSLEGAGFRYFISEIDGCRLVECVAPQQIDDAAIAHAMGLYYTVWSDEAHGPTVTLTDVSELVSLNEVEQTVLVSLMKRNEARAEHVGSAWVVG